MPGSAQCPGVGRLRSQGSLEAFLEATAEQGFRVRQLREQPRSDTGPGLHQESRDGPGRQGLPRSGTPGPPCCWQAGLTPMYNLQVRIHCPSPQCFLALKKGPSSGSTSVLSRVQASSLPKAWPHWGQQGSPSDLSVSCCRLSPPAAAWEGPRPCFPTCGTGGGASLGPCQPHPRLHS